MRPVQCRMGYKLGWLERRELIQILYDHLQDKSKVYVSKELLTIEQLDRGVKVTTRDGDTFAGDMLVGADGVHSRTRKEMWKIADSEDASYGTERMAKGMCTILARIRKHLLTRPSYGLPIQVHLWDFRSSRGSPGQQCIQSLPQESILSVPDGSSRKLFLFCLFKKERGCCFWFESKIYSI